MTSITLSAKLNSSKIYPSVLLLFALYIFPIVGNHYQVLSYGIVYIVPLIYFVMKCGYVKKHLTLNKYNITNAILLFVMIILSVFLPAVRGTDDYGFTWTILGIVRYFIIYFFLVIVVSRVHGEKMAITMFMKYYAISSAIYVIFSIVFYLFPSLSNFWNAFWDFPDIEILTGTYGYTFRYGWSGFSGFRTTYSCSISVIFLLYLYFEKNNGYIKSLKTSSFAILLLLNLLGNMFYGRIGVVIFVAEVLFAILMYRRIRWDLVFIAIIIVFLLAFALSYIIESNVGVQEWFNWMSKPFVQILTTGKTDNYSYHQLVNNMYFMPEFKTFIIGDARYVEPRTNAYYMHTDAGYMRQILFWGIIGSIFTYGFVLYSLKRFGKYKQNKLAILLLFCFVLYEFKGEIFYEMIPLVINVSYLFEWKNCYDLENI